MTLTLRTPRATLSFRRPRLYAAALAALSLAMAAPVSADARRPAPHPEDVQSNAARHPTTDVALAVGETRTISALGVANFSDGTPGIVDVKLSTVGDQFVIVGLKPGSTSLLLIKKDGTQINTVINVFPRSPEQVEAEVTQLLEGYTGLHVRRVGARFFIEGGVATEAEQRRFEQIAKIYPGQVESLVAVGPGGADRHTNIRIDFFFVQYEKDSSYKFGVAWPTNVGSTTVQSTFGYDLIAKVATAQASIINQPLPGLDIAATNGWAKVIKQATVITTNGVEAKLGNGGEQNFAVSAGLTGTIQKIAFGTNVTVLPRFDPRTNDLEVQVGADVSDLVASTAGTALPGRQTSSLSTLVHMRLGQSIVLTGIKTRSQTHSTNGIPLLSEIPVLGVLFGSHSDAATDIEGAVFIVPSIVESSERSSRALIEEAMTQYERYNGNIRKVNTFEKMPPGAPR